MKDPFQKDKYLRSAAGGGERPLRPHFQDFHRLQVRGSHEYPAHQHVSYEVILVARGPYICSLNAQELEVREKELLVIKPGDWHQDHLRKGQQHYVLHFSLGEYRSAAEGSVDLFEKGIPASAQMASYPAEDDFRLFSTLKQESLQKDEYSAAIQDATLEAFFWRMVRHFPAEALSPAFRQRSGDQVFVDRLYRMFERQ